MILYVPTVTFAGSNVFFKVKRLSLPPETPPPEIREWLITLFPCLWDKDYTLDKMLPNHHLSVIRPEPRTAHNLKNWSVAGDLPAIQTPHRSADESSPLQELFSVLGVLFYCSVTVTCKDQTNQLDVFREMATKISRYTNT